MRVHKKRRPYLLPLIVGILLSGLLGLRALIANGVNLSSELQDFITLSTSVLVEATPFVILGISLSLVVRLYVPDSWFYKFMPKNGILKRAYISTLGLILPVCECGNVPLSRGLIMKGLRPSEAITFLFAAPILNPITITTTIIAFGGDKSIVLGRIVGGFLIANIIGWVFSGLKNQDSMLTKKFSAYCKHESESSKPRKVRVLDEFTNESAQMMVPLVIGSMIAGATQVLIPRNVLLQLGSHMILGILAMIALAFVVSICASVDAFFALAYARDFSPGAITSFLVFGPMIDIKMLQLMRTTFTKKTLVQATAMVFLMSFILGLGINYAF